MKLLKILAFIFNIGNKKSNRLLLSDVKPGDFVYVEWERIQGSIGQIECVNNDPLTKKIFFKVLWDNTKKTERVIFKYSDPELKNFHLLNELSFSLPKESGDDGFDIASLQSKMNYLLDQEKYEEADILQKKINKLTGK